jgi:hypothetical protein
MRFSFFRDRLCTQIPPSFDYSRVFRTAPSPSPSPGVGPKPAEPPKFNAAQLQKELGITEAAAKLLTDGGTESVTEQQVLERLKSNKIYDISKRKADSKLDSFENYQLLKDIDNLDGQSGNIKVKDGNLDWEAAGATATPASSPVGVPPGPSPQSPTLKEAAGFAGPEVNPPNKEILQADAKTIQSALEKTGGDKNQKIQYQGVLLTDSDNGSANVRLYSVGEGDNAKYVGIKQGNAQILSQKELEAHLAELNKTRIAEDKPELNTGKIGEILNPDRYLNVPEKTEA